MPETFRRYLRYTSWPIITAMAALMVIGIVAIRAAGQYDPAIRTFWVRQAAFAGVALAAFVAATLLPYDRVGRMAYGLFGVTVVVLAILIAPKVLPVRWGPLETVLPEIRGSRRWVNLGLFLVQPSEIAKLAYVILLARYLRQGDHYRRLRGLIMPLALTLVPVALILKEPDLGTSLLFLPTLFFMLFMAGARLPHLLGTAAVATALVFLPVPRRLDPANETDRVRAALAYTTFQRGGDRYALLAAPLAAMEYHQVTRIEGWLRQNDPAVALRSGYQYQQSRRVLGAGSLTGRGNWGPASAFFRMLPDDHTDFIFSVIGGQWGFAGAASLLLLYGVIFVFGVEIAAVTHDPFGRLLAVGVLAVLFAQICVNVGMTLGLMPITGMTLPLVSYGGSSLVVNGLALGLLVNIGMRRPILLSRRPFEHRPPREKPAGAETPLARPPAASGSAGDERNTRPK